MRNDRPTVGIVLDAWGFPYNGTVVSTRRFVGEMKDNFNFRVLATPGDAENIPGVDLEDFRQLSIPPFNGLINAMRVPLSAPDRAAAREALAGVDVLHVEFPFFLGFSAISAARELGIPVVSSFHVQPENILRNIRLNVPYLDRLIYRLFIAAIYARSDLVIAPSAFARDLLLEQGLRRPVEVISNGVMPQFLELRHVPPSEGPLNLLSVGRLAREKQHAVLIDAVTKSRHRERIRLTIAGAGPLESDLRERIRERGINGTVGPVTNEELLDLYRSADLFVHTGEIELEGMSVTEAMASGNMVLVSDSPASAAREFVTQENATFRCGNADHLASLLDHWFARPADCLREGEANRSRVSNLSHAASVEQMSALYRRLARPSGTAG